jgi:hypothetical protein
MKASASMSSTDFLNKMKKAGEKFSGGGGQGIIGRAKIEFGLHRYVTGHDFWAFFKPTVSESEIDSVGKELQGRLREAGCNDEPAFGIKITIDKNILSRDEPYKADLQEFIPAWQKDGFDLVCDFIDKGSLPMNEFFYGRIQYKANPFSVKQGEAGKTETDQNGVARYPSIRIPVEKFANEAAARAAIGGTSNNQAASDSQWSDTARANYPDISSIDGLANEILAWLEKAKNGIAFNNDTESYPLPNPATPPRLKRYIADIYDVEASDIDLLVPF